MKLTYENLLDDPSLMEQTLAQARRARADAVHDLVVAPLRRFFNANEEGGVLTMRRCSNPTC